VDISLPLSVLNFHSDILNFFTRCANIKSLSIAECDFSSIIAIGELRDTDIVCNLEFLRLEVSDSIHYENISSSTKQVSTDAGEAITSLTRILSSRFGSFNMDTELCSCGGILSFFPYFIDYSNGTATCGMCSSDLPNICRNCQVNLGIITRRKDKDRFGSTVCLPSHFSVCLNCEIEDCDFCSGWLPVDQRYPSSFILELHVRGVKEMRVSVATRTAVIAKGVMNGRVILVMMGTWVIGMIQRNGESCV
jgi:hypothetical protein